MPTIPPAGSNLPHNFGGDDRLARLRFHLWQISLSAIIIFITTWVVLLGIPLLGILAVAIAKHLLVAILVMGLEIYPVQVPSD